VDEAEWLLGVQREAQERDAALQAGTPGVEWHEMKTYLRSRVALAPDVKQRLIFAAYSRAQVETPSLFTP
jgi:hypothetical protein